jgi:hypothetical protein
VSLQGALTELLLISTALGDVGLSHIAPAFPSSLVTLKLQDNGVRLVGSECV